MKLNIKRTHSINLRPPLPPFDSKSALVKVRKAEDLWNMKDPEKVASAYTDDSVWRNRNVFVRGRKEIISFLKLKWEKEIDYKLVKELWCFRDNRIAVRFQYEWNDGKGNFFRSYGKFFHLVFFVLTINIHLV